VTQHKVTRSTVIANDFVEVVDTVAAIIRNYRAAHEWSTTEVNTINIGFEDILRKFNADE
jgi:hypothetical protein